MKVYVCYEANNHSIAIENGPINALSVFSNKDAVTDWAVKQAKQAIKDGFIIDKEYVDTYHEDIKDKIVQDIENGHLYVIMFRSYQENWDESYSIIAEQIEVSEECE